MRVRLDRASPVSHHPFTYLIQASGLKSLLIHTVLASNSNLIHRPNIVHFSYMPSTILTLVVSRTDAAPAFWVFIVVVQWEVRHSSQPGSRSLTRHSLARDLLCPQKLIFLPPLISSISYLLWYLLSSHILNTFLFSFACVLFYITS